MPSASLLVLEQHLEAALLELQKLELARPSLPTAMERAKAGQRIDDLLDEEMVELQQQIDAGEGKKTPQKKDAEMRLYRQAAALDPIAAPL